ncbi:MAG: hypothetical protein KKA62_04240 [Nanoarchaeota archaeon]|nr:hypothetical protein [Nanoarchaeota archaeon]MBU1644597.1 hypothetical protein [Nanoarchaeota archaeon]MBU1977132.1 hypothetical protein [Nanoarchaeota archaeon]
MPAVYIPKEMKIELPQLRVKYKDIFDMKTFYKTLQEWVLEYGWKAYDGSAHFETFYGERVGKGDVKEIWIRWRMKKKAVDAPFTYFLDFDYHCIALISTEVIIDGKKIKANKGEIDFNFQATIKEDYKEKMVKHSLLKYFLDLFSKRVYRPNVEQRKKELYQEMYILQNFIKQWFKLKRYLPYEEVHSFQDSYAFPSHLKT